MKRTLAVAVAIIAMAGVASAADIRQPPIVKAPPVFAPPPPIFTWTGFYIGGNVGYGWSDGHGTICAAGAGCAAITGDGDGVFGGVQIGYNWQVGAFVYGLETDFQVSGGSGTERFVGGPAFGTVDNEWFGTIRARLGYAVDRWLFYVTGGGVYTHNTFTPAAGSGFSSASETGWTWTVGGGVEAALWQNWSVKAEYLFIATPSDVPQPTFFGVPTTKDGEVDTHLIRIGLNYRFAPF